MHAGLPGHARLWLQRHGEQSHLIHDTLLLPLRHADKLGHEVRQPQRHAEEFSHDVLLLLQRMQLCHHAGVLGMCCCILLHGRFACR